MTQPVTDSKAVRVLADGEVDFLLIDGVAASLHGAARATFDLDVVYSRTAENIRKSSAALLPHSPYLRCAPLGLR